MIRESGQIIGLNRDQSKAVQSVLMSKGYTWGGNYLSYPMLDTPNVYWYENKRLMLVPPMGGDLAPHTLADFGLNDQGEPLPTFGNLKPGDPNPFVVGMKVKTHRGQATVKQAGNGPVLLVEYENHIDGYFGFDGRDQIGHYSINSIHPVTEPTQTPEASKPRFEFGDKVKVAKREGQARFVTQVDQDVIYCPAEPDLPWQASKLLSARVSDVTPWPTPITIPLNDNHTATVTPDGITVGCQTFPLSVIDALVEARKKMQA